MITLGLLGVLGMGIAAWDVYVKPIPGLEDAYYLAMTRMFNVSPQSEWLLTANPTIRSLLWFNLAGTHRHDFLTTTDYDSMVAEIDQVEQYALTNEELSRLDNVIERCCHKPNSVRYVRDTIAPAKTAAVNSLNDVYKLAADTHDVTPGPREKVLHILILSGIDPKVPGLPTTEILGMAMSGNTFFILADRIPHAAELSTGGLGFVVSLMRSTVLTHELGHLLGLGHSSRRSCPLGTYGLEFIQNASPTFWDTISEDLRVGKVSPTQIKTQLRMAWGVSDEFCGDELRELEELKQPFTPNRV